MKFRDIGINSNILFQGILINTYEGLAKDFDYTNPYPLHDIPTNHGKIYRAQISIKQEATIHQIGNEKDLVTFDDCFAWKELTSGINCSKICLPVDFHALFGQGDDQPKCHDPSDYQCMMLAAGEKLVRCFFYEYLVGIQTSDSNGP